MTSGGGKSTPTSRLKSIKKLVMAESWEYSDENTQYLTHNIHRYSGKFIPQIAARAITILTDKNELVVDPYCGSGTTLLEAGLLNRKAIGIDLSPLATLIAETKITPIDKAELSQFEEELRSAISNKFDVSNLPLFREHCQGNNAEVEHDHRDLDDWYKKWFQPHVLTELLSISRTISEIKDKRFHRIALVAFSDILRKSSNAHSGYPNVMFDKNAPEKKAPMVPFMKSLRSVCQMISMLDSSDVEWSNLSVVHGSATDMDLKDCCADAVVTHPPYIGSIPYAEYGSISLKWLGVEPKALDNELTGGKRQSKLVVERFKQGYSKMIQETARILKPDRGAFLMVGNPVVRGELIDLAEMTIELATQFGLELNVRTERSGQNRRANKMGNEHLLFFVKTG